MKTIDYLPKDTVDELCIKYTGYDMFPVLPGLGEDDVDPTIVLDCSEAYTGVRLSDGISTTACEVFHDSGRTGRYIEIYLLDGKDNPTGWVKVETGRFDELSDEVLPALAKAALFYTSDPIHI